MMQASKDRPETKLDEEVKETFPASDPPSYMGSTAVAGAPKEGAAPENAGASVVKDRLSVDLNRATKDELGSLPALGPDHVQAILASRPFRSWEDLKGVPNFDGDTIAALKKGGAHISS